MPKGGKGLPVLDEASIAAQIAKNPALLEAVQSKLSGVVGNSSGYIESLPAAVKARINALKNIQVEHTQIEAKFYKELHEMEMRYVDLFKPLYDKRETIANGKYEPTEAECHWEEPEDDDDEDEDDDDNKEKEEKKPEEKLASDQSQATPSNDLENKATVNDDVKGIPEFWLTAMKNVELVTEMIQPQDEELMKKMTDIQVKLTDKETTEGEDCDMGFILEFHFDENDFFDNKVLTKQYKMKSDPDSDEPFEFEGPEIIGCSGCTIEWKKGKNITQKLVKKKQKHKAGGQTRMVTKSIKNDSFFNFFDPPEVVEEDELDEETEALLAADFEIGHFIKERLVPRAVLYFTGEAVEDDDEDEFGSGESDDDDDDEDEENDPDYKPDPQAQNEQCKQQ